MQTSSSWGSPGATQIDGVAPLSETLSLEPRSSSGTRKGTVFARSGPMPPDIRVGSPLKGLQGKDNAVAAQGQESLLCRLDCPVGTIHKRVGLPAPLLATARILSDRTQGPLSSTPNQRLVVFLVSPETANTA